MAAAPLSRYKGSACFVTVHSTPRGGAQRPAGEETRAHALGGRPRAGPPHPSSWKGEIPTRLPRGPRADPSLTPTCSSPCTPRIPPLAVWSAQPEPFGEHVCLPDSSSRTFGTQRIWLWCLQIVSNRWGLGDQFSAGLTLLLPTRVPPRPPLVPGHAIAHAPSATFPLLLPAQGFKSTCGAWLLSL